MRRIIVATLLFATTSLSTTAAHAGPLQRVGRLVRYDALRTRAAIRTGVMKAIGYAEMAGLVYPVKHYQATVSSKLWRGSRLDDAGLADLKARGFSGVVGLTAERDLDKNASKIGLDHLRISIIDNHKPSIAQVKEFLSYMKSHETTGPVYVHCEAGVGRTGVMVAAYRMKVEGWSAGQAIAESRQYGIMTREQMLFIRDLYKQIDTL